jgi:DNA processing protein
MYGVLKITFTKPTGTPAKARPFRHPSPVEPVHLAAMHNNLPLDASASLASPVQLMAAFHLNKPAAFREKLLDPNWSFETELDQQPPARVASALEKAEQTWARAEALNLDLGVVSLRDKGYPELLAQISDPPPLLYWRGDLSAVHCRKTVAIVGARKASPRAQQITQEIMAALAPHEITLVSGMASGVDAWAHQAALAAGLPTAACLAHGLHAVHPVANTRLANRILDSNGCWISEHPPGQGASAFTFPTRNRIIAGLCMNIVVVEALSKSGTKITARMGHEYNRNVFAASPGWCDPVFQGNADLIAENKATPFNSAESLIRLFGWDEKHDPSARNFTSADLRLLGALDLKEPRDLDTILNTLKPRCRVSELRVCLMHAEKSGWVLRWRGDRYTLKYALPLAELQEDKPA